MAQQYRELTGPHVAFIGRQHIFFVASAAACSHVNLSPRDAASFRTLKPTRIAYLDRTGSGNETAAHIRAGGRLTIMFCAFEGPPMILRLYGRGHVHGRRTASFRDLLQQHFAGQAPPGARQIVTLDIELVQTSCGYGVPRFEYCGDRDGLDRWAESKGEAGIEAYWCEKNLTSLDGLPTGVLERSTGE
jgi:hypothetical protein